MTLEAKFYVDVCYDTFPVVRDNSTEEMLFWIESRKLSEAKQVWLHQKLTEILNGVTAD